MMTDVYKVGVSLVLENGVSPVLAVITRDLLGLQRPLGEITKGFEAWKPALVAVAGVLAGGEIVKGLVSIADHGKAILDQQDKLQRAGLSLAEVYRLQALYYGDIAKAVPTSTAAEYLKTTNELRSVTGSTEEAAKLAPTALMVDTLLSNTFGKDESGEYYKLLRSAEMKGISTDPDKLQKYVDQFFSYIVAFGGKLSANDIQLLARRGGTAFINAKPESLGPLAVLAADLGGSAAGTATMTLQQFQQGAATLSKQQAEMLEKTGLLDMSKAKPTGFGGSRLQLEPGAIKGSVDYSGNLPGWIHDVVWPAIMKAAHGDRALAENIIGKMFPNRNAAKLVEMFGDAGFLNQQKKDLGLAAQVEPIPEAYKHFIERNPIGVEKAFNEQLESMLQAMGSPLMAAALPGMRAVTGMFTTIGNAFDQDREKIQSVLGFVNQIGALMINISKLELTAFAKVTGISASFNTLANLPWDALSRGLGAVNSGLENLGSIVSKIGSILGLSGANAKPAQPSFDDRWDALKHHTLFTPHQQPRPTPITLSLNIDGRTLAQAVSEQIGTLYKFPTQAAAFNGASGWEA